MYIVSDGCASQFWSRYIFSLLTNIRPDITIEWHHKETHHWKGPMDGISGKVKNLVYRRLLSGDIAISNPWEFAEFADQISSVNCQLFGKSEFIQEPQKVSKTTPILSTLKVHKVSHVCNGPHLFSNHFFKLSEDLEPFYVEKYGVHCGNSVNNIDDESFCNNCYKRYPVRRVAEVSGLLSVVLWRLFLYLNSKVDFLKIY